MICFLYIKFPIFLCSLLKIQCGSTANVAFKERNPAAHNKSLRGHFQRFVEISKAQRITVNVRFSRLLALLCVQTCKNLLDLEN